MKMKIIAAAIAAMCCTPAYANNEELLQILRDKGVLTEEKYQELRQEAREKRRAEALEKATVKDEREKSRQNFTAKFKDGLTLENADGSNSISIGGRFHTDYRYFTSDFDNDAATVPTNSANQSDTFDIRRARIELKGKFNNRFEFLLTTDLASPSAGNTGSILDQAWVNYKYANEFQIRAGQFKTPMNLEKVMSSNNTDFMERSLVNQLAGNEDRGVMFHGVPKTGLTYGVAITSGEGAKNRNDVDTRSDAMEVVYRGTANFAEIFNHSNSVYHFGLSASDTKLSKGTGNGYLSGTSNIRTEARGINLFALPSIAAVNGVDNEIERQRVGFETAFAWNNYKLQGEWLRNNFQGSNSATSKFDKNLDAWYVDVMWMVTGETYASAYKEGSFGGIKPSNNWEWGGGKGAWELGARYSKFDASDFANWSAATGGAGSGDSANVTRINLTNSTLEADAITIGAKWILNPNMRVHLNYVQTRFDTPILIGSKAQDKEEAVMARVQWNF